MKAPAWQRKRPPNRRELPGAIRVVAGIAEARGAGVTFRRCMTDVTLTTVEVTISDDSTLEKMLLDAGFRRKPTLTGVLVWCGCPQLEL